MPKFERSDGVNEDPRGDGVSPWGLLGAPSLDSVFRRRLVA